MLQWKKGNWGWVELKPILGAGHGFAFDENGNRDNVLETECLYSVNQHGSNLTYVKMTQCRRGKQRRLAPSDCLSLSNSGAGAVSLTQPFSSLAAGRDTHRGLYPWNRKAATQLDPLQRPAPCNANRVSENTTSGKASAGRPHSEVDLAFDPGDFLASDSSIERDVFVLHSNSSGERRLPLLGCPSKNNGVGGDTSTRSLEDAPAAFQQNQMKNGMIEVELDVDPLPDSYFGLLGCRGSHSQPSGHITQLPDEILRAVFCHLPAVDLYRLRSVCQQWRRVLSDPMFAPWKKRYYRYRKGEGRAVMEMDKILKENNITKDNELCMLNLIRYVSLFQHGRSVNTDTVLNCLQHHSLFNQSKLCMSQTLPDINHAARASSTWALQAVIVLLSNSVQEIQRLISCLGRPCSTLPGMELVEVLYCLATLLFALREKGTSISNRIHYNLFYALYLRENPATVSSKQLKHLSSLQDSNSWHLRNNGSLNPELERILNLEISPHRVIKITGYAGTGKTSLLIEYAWHRPHLRFLYVRPTKPVPEDVGHLFPPNVDFTTMRTKAYQSIGHKYHQKKKLMICGLKPFAVLGSPEGTGSSLSRANLISRSLSAFFSSVDEAISVAHVPGDHRSTMEHHEKLELVEDVKRIWTKMVDLRETSCLMTHNGYLKLWQLSKPNLSQFDVILLDEAEDCSPVIMDIVLSQKCGKLLVGDPHQQICHFKGASEALVEAHRPTLLSLTQSFRFGPEIAYVAATILDVCKRVKDKTLVGGSQDDNTSGRSVGQVAILCRTTAAVFDEAVRIVTSDNPNKIYLIGGLAEFGMDTMLDIQTLMITETEQAAGLEIRDPLIRLFGRKGGFRGLRNYAVQVGDSELEERIAVVEKYGPELPLLVEKVTNQCVDCTTFANVILGTVHKAKGSEFETVQIAEDLIKLPGFRHNPHVLSGFRIDSVPDVNWNLLYIAVTRAKRRLVMSRSLGYLLSFANEYFLKPVLTANLLGKGLPPKCHVSGCLNRIASEAVLTMKIASSPQYGPNVDGPLCYACTRQRTGPLIHLLASPPLVRTVGRGRDPP